MITKCIFNIVPINQLFIDGAQLELQEFKMIQCIQFDN